MLFLSYNLNNSYKYVTIDLTFGPIIVFKIVTTCRSRNSNMVVQSLENLEKSGNKILCLGEAGKPGKVMEF